MRKVLTKGTAKRNLAVVMVIALLCGLIHVTPAMTAKAASSITINSLGEHGAQDNFSRWLLRFAASESIAGNAWGTSYSGAKVVINDGAGNSEAVNVEAFCAENGTLALLIPYELLPKPEELGTGVYTMTLKSGTISSAAGSYDITDDFTIRHKNGAEWEKEPDEVKVTLNDDWRNVQGNATGGFYFTVSPLDPLSYDTNNWTARYAPISGGVYVDGTLQSAVKLVKVTESLYYVPLSDHGIAPAAGMKVRIDGRFGDESQAVTYLPKTFVYNGNGTWVEAPAQLTVTELSNCGTQDNLSRWLFYYTMSETLEGEAWATSYSNVRVVINNGTTDSEELTVEALAAEEGRLAIIVPYTYLPGITSLGTGIYKLTLKAGTITSSSGKSYEITQDFMLKHVSESNWEKAKEEPEEPPKTGDITIRGLGEHGAQDALSRWLFRFTASETIAGDIWGTYYNGVKLVINNGTTDSEEFEADAYCAENGTLGILISYDKLPAYTELGSGVYTVTLKSGTLISSDGTHSYNLTADYSIRHKSGTEWEKKGDAPVVPPINATVTLASDWRNEEGKTTGGFYFTVSPSDPLPYDTDNWTTKYAAISGGVSVEDTLRSEVKLIKVTESLYYVSLSDYGIVPVKGMKVQIDGIFGNDTQSVKYLPATFTYDGNGNWSLAGTVVEDPLTADSVRIYDLYELLEISAATIPADSYYNLTDLKQKTNVGLKLHVQKLNYENDRQDITFGLSKHVANNVWVASGYQIKITPALGRILILTEADTVVATAYTEDVKDAFDLEYAVVNMRDKDGVLVARKIYVKINDVELVSYLDKDLERQLGTYVPAFAYNGLAAVVESCSQKGYVLVNRNPVIQDVSELNGGLKNIETQPDVCTHIGTAADSVNIALREKITFNKAFDTYQAGRYDEVKFAFSKDSKKTIWDAGATGYQVWLRPGQIFIGYGADQYATTVNYELPKEFTLEIGTYNVEVHRQTGNTSQYVRDYGRMVYVKIDGQEVASWLDRDMDRKLGKEALVWYSDSTDITISSLTSDRYLIRQANKVYDLFDATGLSRVELKPDAITKLGTLPSATEAALKTKVRFNSECTEFKLAISKTVADTIWDADASGWQFWFRPASKQIFIGYGVAEYGAVQGYSFPESGEFDLEIGERTMVYNDGTPYGREIYMRIDGKEILSWMDSDYSRKLGNYVTGYASADAVVTLESLTTEGYVPVDSQAKTYDIFEASRYASVKLTPGECTNLGKLEDPKNKAIRMNVELNKDAEEFKLAIGKVSDTTIWDAEESGWQFWFRPASKQVFIGYGMSEYAEVTGFDFPDRFTLEVGTAEVRFENGRYYGLKVYIKADGKEILSWIDTDTSRTLGENVLAYASGNADVTVSTAKKTGTLPVVYRINGTEESSCKWITAESTVVLGEDTRINITMKKDPAVMVNLMGVYQNEEALECVNENADVYTYLVKAPGSTDKLVIDMKTAELSTDEATIYDLYDVSGQKSITAGYQKGCVVGNMLNENGAAGVNSALRFRLELPQSYNQVRLTLLGDHSNIWSYNGIMFATTPGKASILYTATQRRLAEANCETLKPGTNVVVEVGIVKCYEAGVYKYDRSYMKVGTSAEDLKLAVWFDSTQRGKYGTAVTTYGTDIEGMNFTLRSLKNVCSITDVSEKGETEKLASIEALGRTGYAVYYPETVEAYSDRKQAKEMAAIKLYPQKDMRLLSLKVAGRDVTKDVTQTEDGGYVYELGSVTGDVKFSYIIGN